MLFVLAICKPPFVLWFTILKYKELIVNFFFGMCWLFFVKSRFSSTISWEFVDFFHEITIQVKHFMGICWLFFIKSQFKSNISWEYIDFFIKSQFRSTISWEFVDFFSWNRNSSQTSHGNSLTFFHGIAIQVKHFMGMYWLFFMKSRFRSTIS